MPQGYRFGRRIALPSTRQILHELRVMMNQDDAKLRAANESHHGGAEPTAKIDALEAERSPK